ncbi:MAG: DUF4147 domain-containing protein [Cypionkella sp.]
MLDRGAPIRDVNLVRRHLSRIKGGRLARAAAPAATLTLHRERRHRRSARTTSARGPALAGSDDDRRRRATALARAGIDAPGVLDESPKPGDLPANSARIIVDPDRPLGRALADALRARGLDATADARRGGRRGIHGRIAACDARRASRRGSAIVIPCEPTLTLPPAARTRRARAAGSRSGRWRAFPATSRSSARPPTASTAASGAAGAIVTRGCGRAA